MSTSSFRRSASIVTAGAVAALVAGCGTAPTRGGSPSASATPQLSAEQLYHRAGVANWPTSVPALQASALGVPAGITASAMQTQLDEVLTWLRATNLDSDLWSGSQTSAQAAAVAALPQIMRSRFPLPLTANDQGRFVTEFAPGVEVLAPPKIRVNAELTEAHDPQLSSADGASVVADAVIVFAVSYRGRTGVVPVWRDMEYTTYTDGAASLDAQAEFGGERCPSMATGLFVPALSSQAEVAEVMRTARAMSSAGPQGYTPSSEGDDEKPCPAPGATPSPSS